MWELTKLSDGKNMVGCKWTYRTKFTSDGAIEKYNARLVAKGFSQEEGIDYTKIFSTRCMYKFPSTFLLVDLALNFNPTSHSVLDGLQSLILNFLST